MKKKSGASNQQGLKFVCSKFEVHTINVAKVHYFHLHFASSFSIFRFHFGLKLFQSLKSTQRSIILAFMLETEQKHS